MQLGSSLRFSKPQLPVGRLHGRPSLTHPAGVDDFIRNVLDGFSRISHGNCREEQRSALQSAAGYVARIVALAQRQSQAFELCPIDEPLAKGDLLGAGNSNSLAPLERRYEVCSVQKTIRGSCVKPSEAPAHTFDRQLPAVEIDAGSDQ